MPGEPRHPSAAQARPHARLGPDDIRLVVRLTPRGGADRVEGVGPAGELQVRVAAPPVEGAANRALVRLLAGELGLPPSRVVLESGAAGRLKRVRLLSVSPTAVRARWSGVSLTLVPERSDT